MSEAIAQKLDEARALIEKGWTQVRCATDASGRTAKIHSDEAVSFCAWAAIQRVADGDYRAMHDAVKVAAGLAKEAGIIIWNDDRSRTQAEVVEVFRKAAAALRARSEAAAVGGR